MASAPPFPYVPDALLAGLTSLELGGPARALASARSEPELATMIRWANAEAWPLLLVGGGSNLVIGDAGFDGLVVHVGLRGRRIDPTTGETWAAAGEPWDDLVQATVDAGLAGFECLSGIPGSVGATPIQNVGAYGREVADLLTEVRVLDRRTGAIRTFLPEDCGFGYRDSRFKREPEAFAVVSVRFQLVPGGGPVVRYSELARQVPPSATLAEVRGTVLAIRRSKSMVLDPDDPNRRSVGSFFTNPVVAAAEADRVARVAEAAGHALLPRWEAGPGRVKLSAAWLIERSGVARGLRSGPVGVSSRHTLALVHHGGGSTRDLLALAAEVRDRVWATFGVRLVPEPHLVGCALG